MKSIFVPKKWKTQDVVLEFEGIYGTARVWINGGLAHTNRNGYMGFMIDLKPWLLYGQENIIKIDVDNSCQPNSRWYTGSGIYRDVNLLLEQNCMCQKIGCGLPLYLCRMKLQ